MCALRHPTDFHALYVPFSLLIAVFSQRVEDRLTLTFEAPLKFDLADVQAGLPPTVGAVEPWAIADNSARCASAFIGLVDVRTFREDNNYMLDVMPLSGEKAEGEKTTDVAAVAAALRAQIRFRPSRRRSLSRPSPRRSNRSRPNPQSRPCTPRARAARTRTAPHPRSLRRSRKQRPRLRRSGACACRGSCTRRTRQAASLAPETTRPAVRTDPSMPVVADVRRQGDAVRLTFAFDEPTPAAVFRRGDTIRLVFDTPVAIDTSRLAAQSGGMIRSASLAKSGEGQIVALVDRPKLTSLGAEGNQWSVVIGDMMAEPTQPLTVVRTGHGPGRSAITVPFMEPRTLHRIEDPEVGDTLLVVTAHGPARGFVKPQDFIEFNALASAHGIVVQPRADDLTVELTADKVVIGRPAGSCCRARARGPRPREASGAAGRQAARRSIRRPGVSIASRSSRAAQDQLRTTAAMAPEAQRTPRAARSGAVLSSPTTWGRKPRACSTRSRVTTAPARRTRRPLCCVRSPTSCSAAPRKR